MHINKFPFKMWANMAKNTPPPLAKIWKIEVTCGKISEKYEGAPKLTGCGAEIIINRKDYYKKELGDSGKIILFWMCPCCGMENMLPAPEIEINVKALDKATWLRTRREDILKELLTGRSISDPDYRKNIENLLAELEIELPDYYTDNIKKLTSLGQNNKVIGDGE